MDKPAVTVSGIIVASGEIASGELVDGLVVEQPAQHSSAAASKRSAA